MGMTCSTYRRLTAAAALALVALAAVGSGDAGTAQRGGTLTVADQSEVVSLSPFTETPDNNSVHVFAQIIENLYRVDPEGKVIPALAETTKASDDFKTWTIGLRKGARFSTGQPLTAEDVVFSLD